jgi:hypothetical protein
MRGRRTEEERSSRPVALLLKAGALAGAIGSMTGLLFTFAPQWKPSGSDAAAGTRVSATIPGTGNQATLELGSDAVKPLTYREYLREVGVKPKYAKGNLSQKGIVIDYRLEFPGYPKGTRFRISYDLYSGDNFVRKQAQRVHLDRDSDSCSCTSDFIALPPKDAIYRVVIRAFQPKAPFSEPVVKARTYPFSRTA